VWLICVLIALPFLALGGIAVGLRLALPRPGPPSVVAEPGPAPAPAEPPAPPPPPEPKEPVKPAPEPGPRPGPAALPLQDLKAATVYIKNEGPGMTTTGSGFVVRVEGDTVYIITNYHVVARPPVPRSRRPPFEPNPPAAPPLPVQPARAEMTTVFRSGTPQEQSARAAVVAEDDKADLAVLKVAGVKDPPPPIDYGRAPQPAEAMPVLTFGFPFGPLLDPKKGNPAVTVTPGSVSSLRQDARGELGVVQIDGDLNPGNSGGPVVGETGALVGVAVAKVNNTRIGFAVPAHKLSRLMDGTIGPPEEFYSVAVPGRETQMHIVARVADPLGRLRAPVLLYGPAGELKMPPRRDGGWQELAGARSSELRIEGTRAVAVLALAPREKGETKVLAQVKFVSASGRAVHSEPRVLRFSGDLELTELLADLKSPNRMTRVEATWDLRKQLPLFRREDVRSGLRLLLDERDPEVRMEAARQLVMCDGREAAPALAKLLKDESLPVHLAELRLIGELKDARVAEALVARLPTRDGSHAAAALESMGASAEKAVLAHLADKDPETHHEVINVIKAIGTAASLPALDELAPSDPRARQAAQVIRERLPLRADEWPQAMEDLKSNNINRSSRALRRLAYTPPVEDRRAEVFTQLESLCENNPEQDTEAKKSLRVKALARWGGKAAVPALVREVQRGYPQFADEAINALVELKDEAAAAAVVKWVGPLDHDRRAAQALMAMGPVAEKSVIPLLGHADPQFAAEACWILAEIGGRDSIAPLAKAVNNSNPGLSRAATVALGAIEARAGGPRRNPLGGGDAVPSPASGKDRR
jgi:S1-C subfamily serine protease/HEAT repeat protein